MPERGTLTFYCPMFSCVSPVAVWYKLGGYSYLFSDCLNEKNTIMLHWEAETVN